MNTLREQYIERYRLAVEALLPVAMTDTSGGRAAAQVLLSTYNAYEFHLDPTDLCFLDPEHFKAAITVIQLRCALSMEPHTVVESGSDRFSAVWKQWEHLHIQHRYAEHYNNGAAA